MTNTELKDLKDKLWQAADTLRAESGLKSAEYATPILGLIFLRFAESKYKQHEADILAEYNKLKGTRIERALNEIAIEKCGFYLPTDARYQFLLDLPEGEDIPAKVKQAMSSIEEYTPELEGTLPRDEYYEVDGKDGKAVLKKLLKTFKDIPDTIRIDIFGEIYEYFLGKFALAEGQGGGEFFTPSSVVRYMVEVLAPTEGEIFDPACGSGGMFVQTAHYIAKHKAQGNELNLRAYGVEKTGATVKLAKMNLALNNIRGTITEANSYYSDPYDCFGKFDYVMANPPFNVDGVELDSVKAQARFNTYGIPQNKTKNKKSAGDTVPNGNYLWISLFATSLKDGCGRAALVMANSASDAGNSEKEIRIRLIESGIISQMVTMPSNMFSTVTLPATLWFFDAAHKNKDEILFIDARNVFTQVSRALRKFSDEQIKNLAVISRLYEGKTECFQALIREYQDEILNRLPRYNERKRDFLKQEKLLLDKVDEYTASIEASNDEQTPPDYGFKNGISSDDIAITKWSDTEALKEHIKTMELQLGYFSHNHACALRTKQNKEINGNEQLAQLSQLLPLLSEEGQEAIAFMGHIVWLLERFPDGTYRDITGLCKAAKIDGEDGIKDQDYSLNPGRYVGVVIEDDGMTEQEFKEEMRSLHDELAMLNAEAHELESKIAENLKSLFGGNASE